MENKKTQLQIFQENAKQYNDLLVTKSGDELLQLQTQLDKIQVEIRQLNNKNINEYKFTTDKLVILMKWKLKRGQFRPQLEKLAASNNTQKTEQAFQKTFKLLYNEKLDRKIVGQSLDSMCVLSGVGPATASKFLSMINKNIPFMSDEAMQMCGMTLNYNKSTFLKLFDKFQEKLKEDDYENQNIDAEQLEKMYWCTKIKEKFEKQKKEIKQAQPIIQKSKKKTQKIVIEIGDNEDSDEENQNNSVKIVNKTQTKKRLKTKQ